MILSKYVKYLVGRDVKVIAKDYDCLLGGHFTSAVRHTEGYPFFSTNDGKEIYLKPSKVEEIYTEWSFETYWDPAEYYGEVSDMTPEQLEKL